MTEPTVAAAAAGVVVIVGCAAVLTWGLLRAAVLPHPMAIVIALSILTMLSIVAGLMAEEFAEQFVTLAATGIGAIAGAVTSSFNGKGKDDGQ
jgi:hypothetical protein